MSHSVTDRRQLLARAIWGTVGLTAATTGASLAAAAPAAASTKTVTYDVACLLNTFTPIVAEGSTDPSSNFRGTTFFVEGELYPAGAIPDGSVVGGAGMWQAATGSVVQHVTGTNTTTGPNFRFVFDLTKKS